MYFYIETAAVKILVTVLLLLRRLFLSSRTGAIIHNIIFYTGGKLTANQPENERKYKELWASIVGKNDALLGLQTRIYSVNPNFWNKFLENIFIRKLFLGTLKRRKLMRKGFCVPSSLCISPNAPGNGCNLKCLTCYANTHPDNELEKETFFKILREQEKLGMHMVPVFGGEPFMYQYIWEAFRSFPHTMFWVSTNGTLLEKKHIREIASLGNVLLMFALEGRRQETDRIRGRDVFQKVVKVMTLCKKENIPFLVNVTVTKNNLKEVVSSGFVKMLMQLGCININYSSFVPVGNGTNLKQQLDREESQWLEEKVIGIRRSFPIFTTIGRNGTDRVTNCFAAGPYFHVLPSGMVEVCPFVHWADPGWTLDKKSIVEVANSPFFQLVRKLNELGIPGFTPCRSHLHKSMQEAFRKVGALPTAKEDKSA